MPSKKFDRLFFLSQLWLLIVVIILGIFFRFTNLETKIFWVDEVATVVRVSGYTIPEVIKDLQAKDTVNIQDLQHYQIINDERSLVDTWQALTKSPEHAPLYFLLTRFWLELWGYSIGIMRALSAFFSLLIFPFLYWLLQELFEQSYISYVGIMLMSVSPFYVAYAQEARPYSLWTVTILFMGASFLRAIKKNNISSWLLYIISLIFAFYTSLLSLFITVFQGIYLLLFQNKNKDNLIKKYLISNAIALICFAPWLWIVITEIHALQDNTVWMRTSLDFTALIATWIGTILLIFGDLPLTPEADAVQIAMAIILILVGGIAIFYCNHSWQKLKPNIQQLIVFIGISLTITILITINLYNLIQIDLVTLIGAIVAVILLAIVTYSLYFVCLTTNPNQWLFILCLLIALPTPLLLADLITQGQSSGAPRYLIPSQLAIQIAVAYTIIKNWQLTFKTQIWKIIVIFLLTLGIFSCTRNLNLSPIYLKSRNIHNPEIAKIINKQTKPLIIVEPEVVGDILSLSHNLDRQVQVKAIAKAQDVFALNKSQFSTIYCLKPSIELKQRLKQNSTINLQKVYQPHLLTPGQIALELYTITSSKE